MISLKNAFAIVDTTIKPFFGATEILAIGQALGRVIAEDQVARVNLPPFDKATMDGYALMESDTNKFYKIVEVVAAGASATQKLTAAIAIKIMTGAPVPDNTKLVIPIENTEVQGDMLKIIALPKAPNIAKFSEDVKIGDLIMPRATRIKPVEIANLIACGITTVKVFKRPRVTIITTGDEIVDDIANITYGKIMNSNGPMIQALCEQYGLDVVRNITVGDDLNTLAKTLQGTDADLIILSGGVSVGDFDFVAEALQKIAFTVHFNKLAVKPGRPLTFATKNNVIAFGLPGNPIAVFLMFRLFVLRALLRMIAAPVKNDVVYLPLAQDYKKPSTDRVEYVPCKIQADGTLFPIAFHGSAHLTVLLNCDGFFAVPVETNGLKCGEKVEFITLY
jgi:molybdopterin molybdotransferase